MALVLLDDLPQIMLVALALSMGTPPALAPVPVPVPVLSGCPGRCQLRRRFPRRAFFHAAELASRRGIVAALARRLSARDDSSRRGPHFSHILASSGLGVLGAIRPFAQQLLRLVIS